MEIDVSPAGSLLFTVLVLFQNGRLLIAEELELRDTLIKELLAFRVKINISTSNDTYEAWREGDHDDLVLATALGCWAGQTFHKSHETIFVPGIVPPDAPLSFAG